MTDLRQAAQQALEALTIYSDAQCSLKGQAAITALRTALAMHQVSEFAQAQEQQAETPPEWPLIKNILAEYGLDAIAFVAEFKAAQRPWVGLTDNDWGWVADRKGTSLDTFDQGAAWAQQRLQERNK